MLAHTLFINLVSNSWESLWLSGAPGYEEYVSITEMIMPLHYHTVRATCQCYCVYCENTVNNSIQRLAMQF